MPDDLPPRLRLEVKISRGGAHTLTQRDLDGVLPDGHVAVLIAGRRLRGPRWTLVPAAALTPGARSESELSELGAGVLPGVAAGLNRVWSNWILDESVWEKLIQQDHMRIKPAIDWCLENHPPRDNRSRGTVRENRLARSLGDLRARWDAALPAGRGPQQEGFLHQYLLGNGLEGLGYEVTVNPVGVPDLEARLRGAVRGPGAARRRLESWETGSAALGRLRKKLLELPDEELGELLSILTRRPR